MRKYIVCIVLAILLFGIIPANAKKKNDQKYKIAVVDLMILKRQKLGAFPLAVQIGADGLELDMGGLGNRPTFDNQLANDSVRSLFMNAAKSNNLEICSLAMTGFYAQSFPTRDGAVNMVQDCINTMKQLGVKVGFLPLGVEGDMVKYPERRAAIVDRLKLVGKNAQDAGVIICVETSLDAKNELLLLKDINSPAIKICFNFANPLSANRNLYDEMRILGAKNIGEIHCTNKDGVWLQNDPQIDMKKVKSTLDKMRWKGWLVVERSRDANNPRDVKGNFGANVAYLKSIFQ